MSTRPYTQPARDGRTRRPRPGAIVLCAACVLAWAFPSGAEPQWVGSWATGLVAFDPPPAETRAAALGPRTPPRVADRTLRQIVRVSIGGGRVRVALSNRFGTDPVEIGGGHLARWRRGSPLGPGAPLAFAGAAGVTLAPGETRVSDPVALDVLPLSELAVDLYLPGDTWGSTSPATGHATGLTTNYLSPPGDHSGVGELEATATFEQWLFLARIDVETETAPGAVVDAG